MMRWGWLLLLGLGACSGGSNKETTEVGDDDDVTGDDDDTTGDDDDTTGDDDDTMGDDDDDVTGDDDDDDDTTGDTATVPTTPTTPEYATIAGITATCFGTKPYYDGWQLDASMGLGDVADSAMVMVANTTFIPYGSLFHEEHPMVLDLVDDWAVALAPSTTLPDYDPGVTSLAPCIDLAYATAIVRVYDADGVLVDCAATGHDPQGWIDGDYDADFANPVREPGELAACRVL